MTTQSVSEICPTALIAYYRLDRSGPLGQDRCQVCLEGTAKVGIVCGRCYSEAREMAEMDETDGLYASIEGIAAALFTMEQVVRRSLAPVPGHDPVKWAVAELPARRRETSRRSEWATFPWSSAS